MYPHQQDDDEEQRTSQPQEGRRRKPYPYRKVRFTGRQWLRVKIQAAREQCCASDLVRRAMLQYLERHESSDVE